VYHPTGPGRAARQHALNDCIYGALKAHEFHPLVIRSGTLWWQAARRLFSYPMVKWQVPHMGFYGSLHGGGLLFTGFLRIPGAVAELSATRKEAKSPLTGNHIFQPLAFESHGPQNASAISFIKKLDHRISQRSGDDRETQFLFKRLSVVMPFFMARTLWLPVTTRPLH